MVVNSLGGRGGGGQFPSPFSLSSYSHTPRFNFRAPQALLADTSEHAMVRHEAGEALGAIGTPECLPALKQYAQVRSPGALCPRGV